MMPGSISIEWIREAQRRDLTVPTLLADEIHLMPDTASLTVAQCIEFGCGHHQIRGFIWAATRPGSESYVPRAIRAAVLVPGARWTLKRPENVVRELQRLDAFISACGEVVLGLSCFEEAMDAVEHAGEDGRAA